MGQLSKAARVKVLQRRIGFLKILIEREPKTSTRRGYLINELKSLQWAIPILEKELNGI